MKDLIERLEERAASYGALRKSSLTAITMDHAADLIQSQQSRIKELEGAIEHALQCTPTVKVVDRVVGCTKHVIVYDCGDPWAILRTTLGDKSPIHPVKTRGTE